MAFIFYVSKFFSDVFRSNRWLCSVRAALSWYVSYIYNKLHLVANICNVSIAMQGYVVAARLLCVVVYHYTMCIPNLDFCFLGFTS